MSKSLLFILSVMIVCSVADPIQDIKSIVERDQCGMNGFATLRPEMENQIALLK